jgi:hypothetical protein
MSPATGGRRRLFINPPDSLIVVSVRIKDRPMQEGVTLSFMPVSLSPESSTHGQLGVPGLDAEWE